jgi:hypothetical protein
VRADHGTTVPHALCEQIQEVLHRRASTQPEPHSRLHELHGARSGFSFLYFGVHIVGQALDAGCFVLSGF